MAVTTAYAGNLTLDITGTATLGGDAAGTQRIPALAKAITFAASGGTAPTIAGWMYGTGTFTGAVTCLLAHATDPLVGAGDAGYSIGFTVASSKLKLLYIENTHASIALTIARAATNGLPIFDTAGDSVPLAAGDILCLYVKAGTAALTTGSNDGLTITPGSSGGTCTIIALYGP